MYMDINQNTIQSIRNWVKLYNEMRSLRNEMNLRKKQKESISKDLVNFMKHQDIDSFDINNGKIEHVTRRTKKPISKKLLLDILAKYYKEDAKKAEEVNSFILENREETVKDVIVRKLDKS